jgi:uncharacterized protein YdaU (DUF1376 family)
MAEKSPPAYQRYVRDEMSNRHKSAMNLEEWGAYDRLRLHIWEEGFLPFDDKELAKILKITPKKFRRLWSAMEKVLHLEDGKITDPDLDEQRAKQAEWRAKSAEGGRRTAELRRQGGVQGGVQGGDRVVQPNPYTSTPTSTSTSTSTSHTHPSVPQRDESAKDTDRVCVTSRSKFSEEIRREYRDANTRKLTNPDGWLIASESGKFDGVIAKWVDEGKPDRSRSKYSLAARDQARQRLNPPVEPQGKGAPPPMPQGATAPEHRGGVMQSASIEPRPPDDDFFNKVGEQPS